MPEFSSRDAGYTTKMTLFGHNMFFTPWIPNANHRTLP